MDGGCIEYGFILLLAANHIYALFDPFSGSLYFSGSVIGIVSCDLEFVAAFLVSPSLPI